MAGSSDVSVVIVNYNSGEFLPGLIDSLLGQDLGSLTLDILVVDSASPRDQSAWLDAARERGANVLESDCNSGYAGGCNAGLRATRGRLVFFVNADVLCLGNVLAPLVEALEQRADAGLVEPRSYLDEGRAFRIPEFGILSPGALVGAALGRLSARTAMRRSLHRLQRNVTYWRAVEPRVQGAVSGAFLGARREVMEELGGFDESFPLFFEDFDLFERVRGSGRNLWLVPAAEIVHYGHRSVLTVWEAALEKSALGKRRFLEKRYGAWAGLLDRVLETCVGTLCRRFPRRPESAFEDLGALHDPPVLDVGPAGRPAVLELTLDPDFQVAAGHLCSGGRFEFDAATWRSLAPLRYFLRAIDLDSLTVRGAWSFSRTPE